MVSLSKTQEYIVKGMLQDGHSKTDIQKALTKLGIKANEMKLVNKYVDDHVAAQEKAAKDAEEESKKAARKRKNAPRPGTVIDARTKKRVGHIMTEAQSQQDDGTRGIGVTGIDLSHCIHKIREDE